MEPSESSLSANISETFGLPSRPFRLSDEVLIDLSVQPAEEMKLWRSRWHAFIHVKLPAWVQNEDPLALASFIDGHLRGRNPMTGGDGNGDLLVTFDVPGDTPESRQALASFIDSLTKDSVFDLMSESVRSDIFYVDLSDIEDSLPEYRRERPAES
jgi:hypothetical protein